MITHPVALGFAAAISLLLMARMPETILDMATLASGCAAVGVFAALAVWPS